MLLITLVSTAAFAHCADVLEPENEAAQTHHADAHNDHEPGKDLTQCHISASDGFGGQLQLTVFDCGISFFDPLSLFQPTHFTFSRDELSLLTKSLSLAPPTGPPKAV